MSMAATTRSFRRSTSGSVAAAIRGADPSVEGVTAPNLPVLVYDGDCGFCTSSATWVRRRLPLGTEVAVEPWQSLDLTALRLSAADVAEAAWWVDAAGARHRGHHAIAAALRAIGGRWAVLGRLLTLPLVSPLAALAYRLIARYRYRLPGSTAACKVPRP
jgi:predicted DCC family thiol-disulfide oxidoreductase YuxK